MDQNLKKIIPFVKKYKKNAILNIIYNTFYALFSTLLMVSLIPTLRVLFEEKKGDEAEIKLPTYEGIGKLGDYLGEYSNF